MKTKTYENWGGVWVHEVLLEGPKLREIPEAIEVRVTNGAEALRVLAARNEGLGVVCCPAVQVGYWL